MARYAGVPWSPSPNFHAGPTPKVRVVLHRMAGSFAGGYAWLRDPSSQVSANFVVDNDSGAVAQLVDTADVAWAQADYNSESISIEIGGEPADPVSDAALSAIASILAHAYELDRVALVQAAPPNFVGVAYHGQLGAAGGNHPDCPGSIVIGAIPELLAEARVIEASTHPILEEVPEVSAYLSDTDYRRTKIREWYRQLLGTGPAGRDPESEDKIAAWLAYWDAHGGEAVYAAIYDSPEAQGRRARETMVFDALVAQAQSSHSVG